MLQMINPGLGELKLTLECCGEAQPLADVAMNNINLNQYTEPIEEKVKRDFATCQETCTFWCHFCGMLGRYL